MRAASHTGKSKRDKRLYSEITGKIDAEPTIKEPDPIEYSSSDTRAPLPEDGNYTEEVSPPPKQSKQENFLSAHPIISLCIAVIGMVIFWGIITIPQDIGVIKGRLEGMQNMINELRSKYDSMFERVNSIDKKQYENDYRLKQLKK